MKDMPDAKAEGLDLVEMFIELRGRLSDDDISPDDMMFLKVFDVVGLNKSCKIVSIEEYRVRKIREAMYGYPEEQQEPSNVIAFPGSVPPLPA